MRRDISVLFAALALLVAACDGEPAADGGSGPVTEEGPSEASEHPGDPAPTAADPEPDEAADPASLLPEGHIIPGEARPADLVPAAAPPHRAIRRMDLDQLAKAVEQVTGGVRWVDAKGNDLFAQLSATLGKPDYVEITHEDLEPGTLFQKFLGDAARAVCFELTEREQATAPAERVFWTEIAPDIEPTDAPEAAEANMRALLLRFHGRRLEAGAPGLSTWMWLLESARHVSETPVDAWRAVCVALITHPDFYTY